ncbi:hydroxyisourate hydrolase [Salinisphaera orenii]|uniref:5-hydroxyisourate hydrolase n=1 Tax=Salinisphaera orenii YIM 95161 TaxID=1051139 RepID=A0A423PMB8_9GAMM|nr:hydroxyisourate hydrolase [Salinisphaera halophila]ROO26739.1 5-hydroxyisourate hydrolase [Salinisphaera halophila YIM 95161]
MGYLTTHVLDTANGCPGAGIDLTLRRLAPGDAAVLVERTTNADGRCDAPLLEGAEFTAGRYELILRVGAYFAQRREALDDPAFLDEIVIRFGIAHEDEHYHVPLLVSPYGYSTYRGS